MAQMLFAWLTQSLAVFHDRGLWTSSRRSIRSPRGRLEAESAVIESSHLLRDGTHRAPAELAFGRIGWRLYPSTLRLWPRDPSDLARAKQPAH